MPFRRTGKKYYVLGRKIQKSMAERKHEDIEFAGTAISSTGTILQLMDVINQNVGSQNRIGNDITLTSVKINYNVTVSSADTFNTVRVIVFQWYPDSNVQFPTVANILDAAQSGGAVSAGNYHLVSYDRNQSQNYVILYDQFHNLDIANNSRNSRQIILKRFARSVINYTVNNIANNEYTSGVYILLVSDSTASPHPSFDAIARVNYYDS